MRYRDAQGLSVPRQVRYFSTLTKLSSLLKLKDFEMATKNDLIEAVSRIEAEDTKFETKRTEKVAIKCFYRWLSGGDDDNVYPPEVRWIKTRRPANQSMLPEQLLTEEEVKKMAESCPNLRDRALILLIYETGGRVGELLPLSIGSVAFDKHGAVLNVKGKTGGG